VQLNVFRIQPSAVLLNAHIRTLRSANDSNLRTDDRLVEALEDGVPRESLRHELLTENEERPQSAPVDFAG
jgi:hypothetical protein